MPECGACTSIINLRYQDGREGSPSNPAAFNHQDYAQLKDQHLRSGTLFVDDAFPPNTRSLGGLPNPGVEWLRPAELLQRQNNSSEPTFFPQGASRFDFGQGYVSNCWFLSALCSLTFNQRMIAQVVPVDQSFEGHAGIFHFRFWRFGQWVDVVVDDLLPTTNNFLLSVHCKGGNIFWVPLLEKAYAKVCGSYDDMNFGLPSEAFKDFSGGVYTTYKLGEAHDKGHDEELWLTLTRAIRCKSMICCTTPTGDKQVNSVGDNGLVIGHSYSVTGVTEVDCLGSKVKLVRIVNPWGAQEWKGKLGERSDMGNLLNTEDQAKHQDGEFWMELENFCHNFLQVSMCCETPNFIDGDFNCQWKCLTYDGSWLAGESAGGSIADSTFETNPQYRIQVSVTDEKEPGDKNILISLMQKPEMMNRLQERFYPAGLAIFKIPLGTPEGRLENLFFDANPPEKQSSYTYERELIELLSLEPGEYAIIPSTKIPYMTADFVLTVYIKAKSKTCPNDDHEHDNSTDPKDIKANSGRCIDEDADMGPTHDLFNQYVDQNGELLATQLQRLHELHTSMIAMVDIDQRMTMTFTELTTRLIPFLQRLFHRSNLNQTGSLADIELQGPVMFGYSEPSSTSWKNFIVLMMRLENTS
ncbi:calpain-1 catalytic subunit [Pleuronectes platessa]|uniref:calpain-1 catalytic subunit n=1 Tax=Pleuronectes platessa TaxID=8262 RepID=UPI00232A1CEE|nr:calpain-1 catalytic subunit [Pleuronectes platessa]